MKKQKLSIILPVFNEEKNIPQVVEKYLLLSKNIDLELIFVEDGGSTDKTRTVLKKVEEKYSFVKILFTEERGYGISIFNGLKKAKGDFVGWTHSDLQTNPKDVSTGFEIIKKLGYPKGIYLKGKRIERPILDKLINTIGMSLFETIILGVGLYDINAQPNIFHSSFVSKMASPPKDFSFDLYAYYLAKKNKYLVKRFPVIFGKRIHGKSAWNTGLKARIKFIKRTVNFTFELKKNLKNE